MTSLKGTSRTVERPTSGHKLGSRAQLGFQLEGFLAEASPAPTVASSKIEEFTVDKNTRAITRIIHRSDRTSSPVSSIIGRIPSDELPADLTAFAESLLLRRQEKPACESGSPVRIADLFSGCGGMSLGVKEACDALGRNFVVAGAFDIEPTALSVYRQNFGDQATNLDLTTFLQADLDAAPREEEVMFARSMGELDFLVAGPPCQGHSNLNNATRRNDPRNKLYLLVPRLAQLARPRRILIENVVTVQHDKYRVVDHTKGALRRLGYKVSTALVDIAKLGVPQTRRRHVLFAYLPDPRTELLRLRTAKSIIRKYQQDQRSLRWAIGDLVDTEAKNPMDTPSRATTETRRRMAYLFDNDLYDLPDSERPDCHRLKAHSYQSVYGRMRWDKPSPTITGGFDTMGRGRFVHPDQQRTLTPHEAARVQGFPDYFDFSPAFAKRRTLIEMIGNAVPPRLSYVFALESLR